MICKLRRVQNDPRPRSLCAALPLSRCQGNKDGRARGASISLACGIPSVQSGGSGTLNTCNLRPIIQSCRRFATQSPWTRGESHDHIGIAGIVARPFPHARAKCAMAPRRLDVEPLPFALLPSDDEIDVIEAA